LSAHFRQIPTRNHANLLGFGVCAALMGYALYAQHGLGYEPCPLCTLQRVAVIALGVLFLLAWLHAPARPGARVYAALLALTAAIGALVAWRHLWIIAQPPGTVAECGASLDYMLEVLPLHEVMAKVLSGSGECAKVDWRFLGLTMPAWVLINVVALGALGVWANVSRSARR
jgi:disulfide bond formation protein DsbB